MDIVGCCLAGLGEVFEVVWEMFEVFWVGFWKENYRGEVWEGFWKEKCAKETCF